jgi:hypothetical protein
MELGRIGSEMKGQQLPLLKAFFIPRPYDQAPEILSSKTGMDPSLVGTLGLIGRYWLASGRSGFKLSACLGGPLQGALSLKKSLMANVIGRQGKGS